MKYKICDGCGANIAADSRACVGCGKRQPYGKKILESPARLMACPTCGHACSENAKKCPQCGEEFETGSSLGKKLLIFFAIIIPLYILGIVAQQMPEPVFAEDGSHNQLVRYMKRVLKDPDSFQHINTQVYRDGIVEMRYRARNSFGGMVIETIKARYDEETGALIEVPLDD